jgi:hypothetical protein
MSGALRTLGIAPDSAVRPEGSTLGVQVAHNAPVAKEKL